MCGVREHQRSVNLISQHPTPVASREIGELLKLAPRHDVAGRIVRIGQHQDAYAAGKCSLQRFKINCAGSTQREQHEVDPGLWQLGKERGIGRREEGHLITWCKQRAAQLDESRHDVRHQRHLILIDRPTKSTSSETGESRRQLYGPRRGVAKIMTVNRRM